MQAMETPLAVVTGASAGIGAATARRLAADGFHVVLGARRTDRIAAIASDIGGTAVTLDVTDQSSVDAFAARVAGLGAPVRVLVNNAGGARGLDPIDSADPEQWQWMHAVNVVGVLRMTKALLPALRAAAGHVVVISSTAARSTYEGGAGYTAAKHGARAMTETLRLELNGTPVRVTEIAPGMVATEEFSLRRFDGDVARAEGVYAEVDGPLVADDIADCVSWVVARPRHVNIDILQIAPVAQASVHKLHRGPIFDR
jgi:NADP-dependent 3-hydroxy acid dehydrogenase YdfG